MQSLIKKLKGTVNNENCIRLGEIFITTHSVVEPVSSETGVGLVVNKPQTISIISGTGHFFNANAYDEGKKLDITPGTTAYINTSNIGDVISIPDKYSVVKIIYGSGSATISINEKNLSYLSSLENLGGEQTLEGTFNVSCLANSPSLKGISLKGDGIYGPLSSFASATDITALTLNRTSVEGNLGDIKTLINLTKLTLPFSTHITSSDAAGDLKYLVSLQGNVNLETLSLTNAGDIALMPSKVTSIKFNSSLYIPATWSSRPNTALFLSMLNIDLGNYIDTMLDNQVSLTTSGTVYINVYGNITANTLTKAKALLTAHNGLSLIINNVTVTQETTELPDNPNE